MSSRDVFHAPECDCPKCMKADGRDAERADVVSYLERCIKTFDADSPGNRVARQVLRAAADEIERGGHKP